VEVKKPGRLGDAFGKSKDVFDNEINIDDICIVYGGRYGIPPQLIKGQMQKEGPLKNFGPFSGFTPSYRYEPFTTQISTVILYPDKWSSNPFFVTPSSMGSGAAVPSQQHTQYISYPREPKTIWYMIEQYSQLVSQAPAGGVSLYAARNADGTINFERFGYNQMQTIYEGMLNHYRENSALTAGQQADSARLLMNRFLRNQYYGGFENLIAQTRIASSYGLIQLLYPTALERSYPLATTDRPENLNLNDIFFPFAMKHHVRNLGIVLGKEKERSGNWNIGFEAAMKRMIQMWNPYSKDYSNQILRFSRNYLPVR
jgi:hypothetical protein